MGAGQANPFAGTQVSILKKNLATDEAIANTGAFTFALYKTDPRTDPAAHPVEVLSGAAATTDADGYLYFSPLSSKEIGKAYWVQEMSAADGYVADDIYAPTVSAIPALAAGDNEVVFRNMPVSEAPLTAQKTVVCDPAAPQPLSVSGLDATYTIVQSATNNALPLTDYTVCDDDIAFFGGTGNTTAVSGPTYAVNRVTIGQTMSHKVVDGLLSAQATPVYAQVNGGLWKLLDSAATSFDLPAHTTGITIRYSDTPVAQDAATVSVGVGFVPGDITVGITIDRFTQSPTDVQPEVGRVTNTATVSMQSKTSGSINVRASSALDIPRTDRPTVSIEKSLTKTPDAGGKVFPGDSIEYTVELKNTSTTASLEKPVIIDVMQEGAMSALTAAGVPLYSVTGTTETPVPEFGVASSGGGEDHTVVIWHFENTTLAPGQSLKLTVKVRLNAVILAKSVQNTAYATSDAELAYSREYPAGASFTADGGVAAIKAGSSEYDELTGCLGGDEKGLFVKAVSPVKTLSRIGGAAIQRSISLDGEDWQTDELSVSPGQTISYQLLLQNNDTSRKLQNITYREVFPFFGDSRNTGWQDALIQQLALSTMTVSSSDSNSDAAHAANTVTYYSASDFSGTTTNVPTGFAENRAFSIVFGDAGAGSFELAPGEVLQVVYSVTLPATLSEAELEASSYTLMNSGFTATFNFSGLPNQSSLTSNTVGALLYPPEAALSGTTWNDDNGNGLIDMAETPYGGVPVTLYKTTDNGVSWTVAGTTVSDAQGQYGFAGLEASYNGGSQYKVVFENNDPLDHRFSPAPAQMGDTSTSVKNIVSGTPREAFGGPFANHIQGDTGPVGIRGNTVFNCGLNRIPYTVSYASGVPASSPNQAIGIPANDAGIVGGQGYAVKGTPQRLGYVFDGWSVTNGRGTGMPDSYAVGDTFDMPSNCVELTARWVVDAGSLSITGYSGTYDAQAHGVSVAGTVAGDVVTYHVNGQNAVNAFVDVTDVAVTAHVIRDGVVLWQGTAPVSIGPVTIVVTADDTGKIYGDADPGLAYRFSDGVAGEIPGFSGSLERESGEGIGRYIIYQGTLALVDGAAFKAMNYTMVFRPGIFTIAAQANPIDVGPTGPTVPIGDTADRLSEVAIDDDEVPLTRALAEECWVHWWIMLGIVVTIVYSGAVIARRYADFSLLSTRSVRNATLPAMRVGNPILLYNKITFL